MRKNNNDLKQKNKALSYYDIMTKNLPPKVQSVPAEVLTEIYRELKVLKEKVEWNRKIYL